MTDWERLGWALREVFPDADYRSDKKIAKAWNGCFAELHLVLGRHVPNFDSERFDTRIGRGSMSPPSGHSKRALRLWLIAGAAIGIWLFWQYHQQAMKQARMTGHSDVWAKICEDQPKLAERLLPTDETGLPYRCKDF